MKKVLALLVCALLTVYSCTGVFAAGINSAEQSVLSNMQTPAMMNGNPVYVPANYLNQAEAYFNTIEMTNAQADEINSNINAGRSFLEGTGKGGVKALSSSQLKTLLSYAAAAADVLNLTAVAGSDEKHIKVITKDGDVVVDESDSVIKTTGPSSKTLSLAICCALAAVLFTSAAGVIILRKKSLCHENIKK